MSDDVTVDSFGDAIYVRATDKADQLHRWWFDRTEKGRLTLAAEVIVYDEDSDDGQGRHYVPGPEMDVPDRIVEALEERGYENLYDSSEVAL